MQCIFDNPIHPNGGCIFDNQLIESAVSLGGGGAMFTGWEERVKREDEELMMILSKFLEVNR